MALLHSRRPQLKIPQSHAFHERVNQPGPFSDEPPNKRPRPERKRPLAVMTAQQMSSWSETSLKTLLRVSDGVTIDDLEQTLERDFDWHLHAILNVPVCGEGDDDICHICETYVKHVEMRRGRADEEEPGSEEEALIRNNTRSHDHAMEGTDDDSMKDTESESDTESDSEGKAECRSQNMKKLFRLRDLYARRDAFDANDDDRAIGQLEGMMCSLQTEKLRAEADSARANASWAVAQQDLAVMKNSFDTLNKTYQELVACHQLILDENMALKEQTRSAPTSDVWQCPNWTMAQWLAMPKPTPHDPPQILACWLQFQEHINLPGIPFHDAYTLDLRDLRGYTEVMARLPESTRNQGRPFRKRCAVAMTRLLAIPGRYEELVGISNYRISTQVRYCPLFSDAQENITEEDVAERLASQGLTPRVADDAWQYCYNVVSSEAVTQVTMSKDEAVVLCARIEAKLEEIPRPAGINPPAQDIFRRPRNLPSKRAQR